MGSVSIVPLTNTKKEIKKFVKCAWKFYKGNKYWVPPLIGDLVKFIHEGPYHQVGVIQPFLAYRDGEIVGRIIAHYDNRHNEYYNEKQGRIGFFESVDDTGVSRALFSAAEKWLKEKGMNEMAGPYNFMVYDTPGVLLDDFENIPALELNYNPPYYPGLYEDYNIHKMIDWYAYKLGVEKKFPKLFYKMWEKVKKDIAAGKDGLVVRNANLKRFDEEKEKILSVFNPAWDDNWGHYPLTRDQWDKFTGELKQIVKEELVLMAEYNGKMAGFIVSVPDVNVALQKANGRLFPFGFIKILLGLRKVKRIKTIVMGLLPEYRMRGIDAYFYVETFERARAMGYTEADMSLIVEDNHGMRNALEHMGAEIYKTYRLYSKKI